MQIWDPEDSRIGDYFFLYMFWGLVIGAFWCYLGLKYNIWVNETQVELVKEIREQITESPPEEIMEEPSFLSERARWYLAAICVVSVACKILSHFFWNE